MESRADSIYLLANLLQDDAYTRQTPAYKLTDGSSPLSSVPPSPTADFEFVSPTDSRRDSQLQEPTENEELKVASPPLSVIPPPAATPVAVTTKVNIPSSDDDSPYLPARTHTVSNMTSTAPKASVENRGAKYVPVLTDGEIDPNILVVYENACQDHFEERAYTEDEQVKKILGGLQGPQLHEWFTADRARIQKLKFADFMAKLRAEFLDSNWQDEAEQELLGMVQGDSTFKEFSRRLEVANAKLMGTAAHLSKDRVRQQLTAGLSPALRRRVNNSKAGEQKDYKLWKEEMCHIDDALNATFADFEEVMKKSRLNTRTTSALGEPSRKANTPAATGSKSSGTANTGTTKDEPRPPPHHCK